MIDRILEFDRMDDVRNFLNNTHLGIAFDDVHIDIIWLGYHISVPGSDRIIFRAGVHKHSFYELHFCLQGSCVYQVDNNQYTIMPGEMIILRAKETHCLLQKSLDFNKVALGFDIRSQSNKLSVEICRSLSQRPAFVTSETEEIAALFYKILEEAASQKMGYLTQLRNHLLEIIIQCARLTENKENHQPSFSQRIDKRVSEINKYIETHMDERVTCQNIADNIHLSVRQLNRIVQNEFGMPVSDYIDKLKCEYAKNSLLHSDVPISYVAAEVGFSSEFSFSKFFKRVEGMAPSQFRRSKFGGYVKSVMDDE